MRAVNRLAAAVLGLALIVVGLVAVAEIALIATGRPGWPSWLDSWLGRWTTTTVGDNLVFFSAIGAAVLGLIILALQVRRWRPDRLPAGDAEQGVWWLQRRGVERRAGVGAAALVGVSDARANVRGGARHWRVRVTAAGRPEHADQVAEVTRLELGRLDLPADAPVEVNLRPRGRVT
jgi:hypothetical protein